MICFVFSIKLKFFSDSEADAVTNDRDLDNDAAVAMGEFAFLNEDEWSATDQDAIDKLKERYK